MHGGVARLHMPHDDAPGMLVALRVSNGGSNADLKAIATGADEGENHGVLCQLGLQAFGVLQGITVQVHQAGAAAQLLRPWYCLRPCGEGTARRKGYALGFGFLVGVLALGLEGAPEPVPQRAGTCRPGYG